MTTALKHARLLAALVALAACGRSDAPKTDSAAAVDGATTTITPSTAGTPVDTSLMRTGAAAGTPTASAGLLDPDSATAEQLAAVPGMTAAAAAALVKGRPWADMTAADRALAGAGLSADARKQVYAHVWKPIDLNKASKAEILLIPGVGPRMQHEFEEYRPYKDLATFDREIGKYVDKAEVARLRKYVSLR